MSKARNGMSFIELVVAVAVLGILLSIGVVQLRPPSVRLFTNDVKALIEQARYEAIKRNAPVAVVYAADEERFETRVDLSGTPATLQAICDSGSVLLTRDAAEYRGVGVTVDGGFELVWLPSGQRRTCGGQPAAVPEVATIADGRLSLDVEVSIGGRVSVQ